MIHKRFLISYLVLLALGCAVFSLIQMLFSGVCGDSFVYYSVYDLSIIDNVPHLQNIIRVTCWDGGDDQTSRLDMLSQDYGKTWQETGFAKATTADIARPENIYFYTCAPNHPQTCFRITGKEKIEISSNGGKSWEVDWREPTGRQIFINRNPRLKHYTGVRPDTVPYDLSIVEDGDTFYVMAAMGTQGVLVRSPEGNWKRYDVNTKWGYTLGSFPFYATNFPEIRQYIGGEIKFSLLAALFFLYMLSIKEWRNIHTRMEGSSRGLLWSPLWPFIISVVVFLTCNFLCVAYVLNPELSNDFLDRVIGQYSSPFSTNPWLIPFTGLFISWLFILMVVKDRKFTLIAILKSFGLPLSLIPLTLLPFMLWAIGIIQIYWVALIIACIINILIAIVGFREPNFVRGAALHKKMH